MNDFTHKMHVGDKVEVTHIVNDKNKPIAQIVVNGELTHRFSASSRVSKHLEIMTPQELEQRLTGGHFFSVNDQLIDFRDGSYNGFIHPADTIDAFMDVLGVQNVDDIPLARRARRHDESDAPTSNLVLRKVWDKTEITVPGYKQGGDFNSELSFVWNPFVKTVNSSFDLVRLICSNGMVGLTSFLNTKVPLFNRWEEHLDIAARQIQNKVNSTVVSRIQRMRDERASLADCLLVASHAFSRMTATEHVTAEQRTRLEQIFNIANPRTFLETVYRSSVYEDKNLCNQLPGHLTHLDVFNMCTEIRTHSPETAKSSNHALDKMANGILFDQDTNAMVGASSLTMMKVSVFSDAEAAFFGNMS